MDQLRPVFRWLKKNVFWLCCFFLSLAMMGIWFFASGALEKETKDRTRTIKGKIAAASGILNVKPDDMPDDAEVKAHPNAVSEEGMKKELSETIDSIVEAWTIREKAQQNLLVWPKVIPNKLFVDFFGQYNPPETFPPEYNTGLAVADLLELYKTKIPQHMLYLTGDDLLRTRWNYDPTLVDATLMTDPNSEDGDYGDDFGEGGGGFGGGFGGGRGGGGMSGSGMPGFGGGGSATVNTIDLNKYAVIWSDTNQALWNKKLTSFQGRDDNRRETNDPTPLQCYMLQQDLWLLEAMFKIVREVNGNSNANDLSVIKNIDHVVFGREVGGKLGELVTPDQRLAGKAALAELKFGGGGQFGEDEDMGDFGDEEPDFGAMFGGGSRDDPGGMMSGGEGGLTGNSPYEGRYVDLNFEPLPAETVKNVITGKSSETGETDGALPEKNIELIVAKRVPVRIALRMDERKIADFMAACANSPFAFEIQQVRWNRHKPGGEEIPLGGAGSAGDSNKLDGMSQDMGGSAMGSANLEASIDVEKRTNYDVNVEFYGIVKIYNPVRPERLRKAAGLMGDGVDPVDAVNPRP